MKVGTSPSAGSITVVGNEGAGDSSPTDLRHVCVAAYGRGVWLQQRPDEAQIISTWANWDVTGALQDSENVSSITDNNTGDWTMNMRVPYASEAAYVAAGTTQGTTTCWMAIKQATAMAGGSINFQTGGAAGGATDPNRATAMAWGYF